MTKSCEERNPRAVPGLKVHQWLPEWDDLEYDETAHRRRPRPQFYLFSLSASELKALSGIHRRSTEERQAGGFDSGIQRGHNETRSEEIARFIRFGFPWSALSNARRSSGRYDDLKKPGWLPTAVVVNILEEDQDDSGSRRVSVDPDDLVAVRETGPLSVSLELPRSFTGRGWKPKGRYPVEVIDGQHRLWAFEGTGKPLDYQLPVVAFHGLDLSWQAYLFYTINIKPVKINASLAYDLYPLLRTEDWLERFEGPAVYREARSQELTQALWATPSSPWYRHINMLGESGLKRMVRQAAWIRSLMASYVKSSRGTSIGGLFGGRPGREFLPWNGAQQAAFLIFVGQRVHGAITECDYDWARALRSDSVSEDEDETQDRAFYGPNSLLNTDQGIRCLLFVTNDLCYTMADYLGIQDWFSYTSSGADDAGAIDEALEELWELRVAEFVLDLSSELARFDWRTSAADGLDEEERVVKAAYRGSGGYRVLRTQVLHHLSIVPGEVGNAAMKVIDLLGYGQE